MKRNPDLFRSFSSILMAVLLSSALASCNIGNTSGTLNDHAFTVALQSDGKIVAAGESYSDFQGWNFSMARYASNGSLDTSFGKDGKVLTTVNGGATAIAIQSDGKIILAGTDHSYSFILLRFNPDGTLDTSFGNGGVVSTMMNGGATSIVIQGDGKIIAAGYSYNGVGYDFALVRYDVYGNPDPFFGFYGNGVVITGNAYMNSGASNVSLQPDGKIVAAGGSYLIRYNSDGSLDMTFGSGGKVESASYYDSISGAAVQSDGKIVTAGSLYNGLTSSYDFTLYRYNFDGSPDLTFNGSGMALITASYYPLVPATVVPDTNTGKIVASGYSQYQTVILRANSDGSPDAAFAYAGSLVLTSGSHWGSNGMVRGIAVQGDSKIVMTGSTYIDGVNGFDYVLERRNNDGSLDTGFGNGGLVTTDL